MPCWILAAAPKAWASRPATSAMPAVWRGSILTGSMLARARRPRDSNGSTGVGRRRLAGTGIRPCHDDHNASSADHHDDLRASLTDPHLGCATEAVRFGTRTRRRAHGRNWNPAHAFTSRTPPPRAKHVAPKLRGFPSSRRPSAVSPRPLAERDDTVPARRRARLAPFSTSRHLASVPDRVPVHHRGPVRATVTRGAPSRTQPRIITIARRTLRRSPDLGCWP